MSAETIVLTGWVLYLAVAVLVLFGLVCLRNLVR